MLALLGSIVACGSSSSSSTPTSQSAVTSTNASSPLSTAAPQAPPSGSDSVSTGPVRGRLTAANHTPTAGRLWDYSVNVTSASGKRLSGTVDIEFVFGGDVVGRDTPPTHPVRNGSWHDNLKFPADAAGEPLMFQAVVHTSLGSITLDWPITVQK